MAISTRAVFSALLLLSPTLLQPALAIDYDAFCRGQEICLTSFIFCADSCSYPEHVYPLYPDPNGYTSDEAALLWDVAYDISWRTDQPQHPVLLEWRYYNASSLRPDRERESEVIWSRTFTADETSFTFEFRTLAEELAADNNDIDVMALKGQASRLLNTFRVSQPEAGYLDGDSYHRESSTFTVLDGHAEDFFETQRVLASNETRDEWLLGVRIGVGIGVPLLFAIAFAVGFFFSKYIGNLRWPGRGGSKSVTQLIPGRTRRNSEDSDYV